MNRELSMCINIVIKILLFGCSSQSWKQVQRLCNPQGHSGLNRRMFELQPSRINPELLARAKEIFQDIDISKVQNVGPGAVTFYVWVSCDLCL